jgi:uncharacterized protein involved in exopolysaccharide biosynthesis
VDTPAAVDPRLRDEEITVRELLQELWRAKWVIVAVTVLVTGAAITAAFVMPPQYLATAVVSPVARESGQGLGGLGSALSEVGGLASLVGVNLSAGGGARAESLATLESEALTERYVKENNLLPVLFWREWNAQKQVWKTSDPKKVPTLWKANQFFKGIRRVSEEKKTGLTTVSVEWKDPQLAAKWANDLVRLTNDQLRARAIREAENNIAYLNDQAEKTRTIEVKQNIYTLLQSEIRKAMLAQGTQEYALRVVDPAFAPEKPSSPKRALWALSGFLIGALAATGFVVARFSWRER